MSIKDPIVQEIHRHRAAYAKRFNCDVRAIGEDIRRCEIQSKGKFTVTALKGMPPLKRDARKASVSHRKMH